jgi:hypothetical protein
MLELFPISAAVTGDHLSIGGVEAVELAERFGTPLVVYCEQTLRAQARALREATGGHVAYGTKAFANVALLRLLREEGIGADVASSGELAFAREAGYDGAELVAHGNNKDKAFLGDAAQAGATVVLDAPDEAALAADAGGARVLVRVTLGVDADTHEAIRTGHHGSKFGLPPAASTSSGSTFTSARSSPTSTPRRRRSSGSPRSRRAAGAISAGRRVWPTSAGASASGITRTTTCRRQPSWHGWPPRPHARRSPRSGSPSPRSGSSPDGHWSVGRV